jgi:CRP-like cAMP-binding protein
LANQKLLTQNFSVEAMKEVALMMEEKNLTAGEHLFVQGQYDSRIFIIVKGSLQLLHSATGRAEVPVGQLTEGRILGLADGMRNAARRVSARA